MERVAKLYEQKEVFVSSAAGWSTEKKIFIIFRTIFIFHQTSQTNIHTTCLFFTNDTSLGTLLK